MPRLSVLLPVRDAGPWLAPSLASLWRQSFRDFEVVAVDDGSTDGSGGILDRAAAGESRLRVFHTGPRGLPAALNHALVQACGDVVARHDADDLSHRDRFTVQIAALARAPEVDVVGTRLRLFPAARTGAGMRRWSAWHNALLRHEDMEREALIDSVLAHGTAMIRRSALESVGGWQERGWAEDMDLWLRLLARGHRFAKIDRTLYAWRQHPGSATRRDPRYRRARMDALRLEALADRIGHRLPLTVIGVGGSLERWTTLLHDHGWNVTPIARARPDRDAGALTPPLILVFGAAPARARWRNALIRAGRMEGRQFVFVA
jgi:glycosyltransferase involved in cell wall biosynthesis